MSFLGTVGISVLCAVCALLLKECKSSLAPLLTVSGGICVLLLLIPRLAPAIEWASALGTSLPAAIGETVSKVLSVGLLCGVGSDICADLGAPALGARLELAGKVEIFLLSLPLLKELFSRVEALLS